MDFRLLGPVQVVAGGRELAVGGWQRCALLAMLLLHANRTVPADRLIDVLWTSSSPRLARRSLQVRTSQLRRLLADAEPHASPAGPERLVFRPPGYLLRVMDGELDVRRFERLADEGRRELAEGRPRRAAEMLGQALKLWRGGALEDVEARSAVLAHHRSRLEQRRLAAVEDRVDAGLSLGHHEELVGELGNLVAEHPLRQRLRAQFMLALHRCGRPAEALAAYREAREVLVEELGLEPGPQLQRVERMILTAGGRPAPAKPADRVRPAQLPADVPAFTGRADELARLDALLAPAPAAVVISAVSGTAGVGKTALAVHWAHRNRHRFPDGQLYVNLHGYDRDRPMTAADALCRFLSALGVPGPELAADVDELAARFRSEIADRRMLVVLDNAATVEQVRPLLPGTGSSAVLVTSRDSLSGLVALHGAHRVDLDLLPPADAVALLRGLIGERADADPGATAALAAYCARLPLALRVAAERAASSDSATLHELIDELADQHRRLDLLDAVEDPRAAIATVFSWSVRQLPPGVARVFRLLGLHPGPDADAYAVAALAGTDLEEAGRGLDLLTRAHLVHRSGPDRYGMHDLLRSYAAQLAAAEDSTKDIQAARRRLFDHYLATAAAATERLYPAEANRRPGIPAVATPTVVMGDLATARTWLDAERPTLAAVATQTTALGWPEHAVGLSAVLFRYLLDGGGHYLDALVIHGRAHAAAQAAGDRIGQARTLTALGGIDMQMGRHGPAAEHLERAVALFRSTADRIGEARALNVLGALRQRLGDPEASAHHHERALAVYRQAGDGVGEAQTLINLGIGEKRLGRYDRAADRQRRALDVFRRLGDRNGEAYALANLGDVEAMRGGYDEATDHHTRALALFRQVGNRVGEAWALDSLGTVHTRLGRTGPATEHHRRALAVFDEVGDRDGKPWALNGLGEAAHTGGRTAEALTHHAAALTAAAETGARDQQARAHSGLGRAHRVLGDRARARRHYEKAAALYTRLGMPDADRVLAILAELSVPEDASV